MRTVLIALLAIHVFTPARIAWGSTVKDSPGKPRGRWYEMDYGPFLCFSYVSTPGAKFDNNTGEWKDSDVTPRGICVKLAPDWSAGMIFDSATMRMSAGWIGAPWKLIGPTFNGQHDGVPQCGAIPLFQTPNGPGWASPEGSFADPRKDAIRPLPSAEILPANWAKYKGLYRHGDKVILSYSVGNARVLELPGLEGKNDLHVFTRTIRIEGGDAPLILRIAEVKGATGSVSGSIATLGPLHVGVAEMPQASELCISPDAQILLKIPPSRQAIVFKVLIASGGEAATASFAEMLRTTSKANDPAEFTHGGPTRWTPELATRGTLGMDTGAYATDSIAVPYDNPWKSWMRLSGFDFFKDGTRAAVCTWSGDVWIVSGIDAKLESVSWKRFATGLHQPMGLKIVDDVIYVVDNAQITRLQDLNADGEADFYENFFNGWQQTTGLFTYCFDLELDEMGDFVFSTGTPVRVGGRGFHKSAEQDGCIIKVRRDGSAMEVFATGFREPNGIGVGPNGEITSGDNEGTWVPMCPLHWVKRGSFNGVCDMAHGLEVEQPRPICWMPKYIDNSNGDQIWVPDERWGPFKGELFHLSYGTSSLYKVMWEFVDGQIQGGVVKIPASFTSSAMRSRFNPKDGQLYVTGLKGWQTNASQDGGFNRVRYTGKPVHLPRELHVLPSGLKITFTELLDAASAADPQNYNVEIWNYKWSQDYGSAEYNTTTGQVIKSGQPHEMLPLKFARLEADGKTVVLDLNGLKPVMQMKIRLKLKAADGSDVAAEIYNTIHRLPK